MTFKLIGIAGGSGAGKSTICYKLVDEYPEKFEVINLDDFQKKKTEPGLPLIDGKINWDHPDIIDWKKLISNVSSLLSGNEIEIDVWSHRSNPNYASHGQMLPRKISPKPYLLLEGYLALYNPMLNNLCDRKFYLDVDERTRNSRRDKDKIIADHEYVENVLNPMFKQYVEPTKKIADEIIDVSRMSIDEAAEYLHKSILDSSPKQ